MTGIRLSADIFEDESTFHARLELPGVSKKDVKLEVENSVMTVSYEHHRQTGEEGTETERYSRSFSIPDGVEVDKVKAKLKDGILHIEMPKAEKSKPRTITVK